MILPRNVIIKKKWFINSRSGGPKNYFDFDHSKELGKGSYGTVVKAIDKITKQKRAIKIIPKTSISD